MLGMRSFVLQKWEMVAYRRALVFNSHALKLRNIAAASRVLLDEWSLLPDHCPHPPDLKVCQSVSVTALHPSHELRLLHFFQ
jgi:hypothetical protein